MTDADSLDHAWGSTEAPALTWQVNTRGRKTSEMTLAELGVSIRAGKLSARTLVWSEGMSEWTPLGDVPSLAKLLRDSTPPPPSGTRPRLEELVGGARPYTLSNDTTTGDATTDTGGIAIYERPVALIEFPKELADVEDYTGRLEELSEPEDEPTRAAITPARVITPAPRPAVPAPATASLGSRPSVPRPKAATPSEPPLPPLPPMRSVQPTLPLFPSPVTASPLGAALSSTAEVPETVTTDAARQSDASSAVTATSPVVTATSPAGTATSPAGTATSPTSDDDAPESDAAPTVKRPRPAIEHLPPIIVHEKEDDDGASAILELPLHPPPRDPLPALREAPFSESTLVLSGRRRARRWIPLNAAISLGVGAACLASALTAVTVRTRPAPPRVVEKIVTVPATAAPAPEPAAAALPANATAASERDVLAVKAAETPRSGTADRTAKPDTARADAAKSDAATKSDAKAGNTKSDATNTDLTKSDAAIARNRDAARSDPSGLDTEPKPNAARREARAGFPTNPGF